MDTDDEHLLGLVWLTIRPWRITMPVFPANTDSLINTVEDFNDTIPFSTGDYSMKSLKCWYTNADSLLNKLDELKCNSSQPDSYCLCHRSFS